VRTTSEQQWVLGLTSLGSVMVALDVLVVAAALTTIRADLGASAEQLEWTVNAYGLSFAMLLMTAAAIGDRWGRRRTYVGGLVLFSVASVACALATSLPWLIAARAVHSCCPGQPRSSSSAPSRAIWSTGWASGRWW
jgi:MFS family permease